MRSIVSSLNRNRFIPKRLCNLMNLFTKFRGPMSSGENFITLDEQYLDAFDEIIVIGDIHGCSIEFEKLLDKVHTESASRDPDKCLKILVGDLVNKGPYSKKVLRICRDKYPGSTLAVRGNHDEIALSLYEQFKATGTHLAPKNRWVERLPRRYISYLEMLPFTISIPSLNCIIVHAGIDPSLEDPAKTTPTKLMTTMRNIVVKKNEKTGETYYDCSKSDKEGIAWATFWPGPEHIYFGHDAKRRLQDQHEFATGLDTGCVYGDRLSYIYIKGPRKGELNCIKAEQVYEPISDTEKK